MRSSTVRAVLLGSAMVLGFGVQSSPFYIGATDAYAQPGEHGGGGKGGNGSDHGNSGSQGQSGDHGSSGNHGKSGAEKATGNNAGKSGALNAAHASPTALANASPNSRVGLIASYEGFVEVGDLDSAAVVLQAAANKPVTRRVVRELNRELGITMTAAEIQALLDAVHSLSH
jgi:hypothetical protein